MSGSGKKSLVLACGVLLGLSSGRIMAATAQEWNPVRTHAVAIGPEAGRLVVGFRALPGKSVTKVIATRARTQTVRIVQAKTSMADVAGLVQRSGIAMARSRQLTPSMHVVYLQKVLYGAALTAALDTLRADPAVEFAEIDQRRYAMAVPNDPLFVPTTGASGQWYMQTPSATTITVDGTATQDLSATDAVTAWSTTQGSSGTVIADVDSGIRFDHPDLLRAGFGGRLLPGYDFVDQDYNPTTGAALGTFLIANDGDGWDPDPSDPGDWINSTDQQNTTLFPAANCPIEDSSWHGTRVMGILGAITNNEVGIAGMTWNPYLLPVRALGKCGGYDSDIIAGMQWAVGMTVNNPDGSVVPDNPYPADIVNLSLGGSGACPADYQSAIDTLNSMGVLVVASAGNESGAVAAPGNCSGVLAVAGLRNVGTKVGYSSFGSQVGIAAPAGNCVNSSGACLRSIDTTYNTGLTVPATNSYTNQINDNLGTSFAAPIVTGIAALMRAVNANLTPAQLIARLETSATPFPANTGNLPVCPTLDASGECSCVAGQCGAGMVNALSAVGAALNPIAAITAGTGNSFDASASVAACNQTIASYSWTATGGVAISGAATGSKVTVTVTGAGTLALAVTDAAGHADHSASVSFSAAGAATVNAPSSVGTAATACPTAMTVTPVAPTVSEAFSPASVGENTASTLSITFNNANGFALTQSNFSETLPANLSVETSPAPTTDCPGASGTLTSSASGVTLAGANIPASGSCSITLSVKSATAGTYTSTAAANALTTAPAGSNSASASASLTVTAPAGKSGGGGVNWWDLVFGAGVLVARWRYAGRADSRRRAPG